MFCICHVRLCTFRWFFPIGVIGYFVIGLYSYGMSYDVVAVQAF